MYSYQYRKLSDDEDQPDGLREQNPQSHSNCWQQMTAKALACLCLTQVLFFATSCYMMISGLVAQQRAVSACHDRDFLPMWSPILEAVQSTGHFHRFDGSFATPNAYKGSPKPSIDAAWDRVLMANGKSAPCAIGDFKLSL
jgi:hypothetical protein